MKLKFYYEILNLSLSFALKKTFNILEWILLMKEKMKTKNSRARSIHRCITKGTLTRLFDSDQFFRLTKEIAFLVGSRLQRFYFFQRRKMFFFQKKAFIVASFVSKLVTCLKIGTSGIVTILPWFMSQFLYQALVFVFKLFICHN